MNRKRKIYLIIVLLILLLSCILIFLLFQNSKSDNLTSDKKATDWNGRQELEQEKKECPQIAIPGIASSLVFNANTTTQKVNFYNPEENDCLFLLSLYVNNSCYWESGYLAPSKCYYSIDLFEPLEVGEYDAYLLSQCYKEKGTALNSAKVDFILKVIE